MPNIRDIYNEVEVGGAADFATRTKDTSLTARVKAGLVRERNLSSNAIKVVTERSTVYLMGLVTHDEGERAAIISSRVSGVTRVVTLFEYITEEELAKILGPESRADRAASRIRRGPPAGASARLPTVAGEPADGATRGLASACSDRRLAG